MEAIAKSERVVVLCAPDFKRYLVEEAKREGISVSEIIRKRCDHAAKGPSDEERVLLSLIQEVRKGTQEASKALSAGLDRAEEVLVRLEKSKEPA